MKPARGGGPQKKNGVTAPGIAAPRRLAYLILAYACIGLGVIGVFLPLLPTTPFLLVAAWAAPKASPRLDAWLLAHPRFGPLLRAWREERAVPTRAKWLACVTLALGWVTLATMTESLWIALASALLFVSVGTYVCTRPAAARDSRGEGGHPDL